MYFISLRGMGMLNHESKKVSGEQWFLNKIREEEIEVIFDVGANIGAYSKLLRSYFPKARILAFEPHPNTFSRLQENTREQQIQAVNIGIGAQQQLVQLFDYEGHEGSSHASLNKKVFSEMYDTDFQSFEVNINTIDQYCLENKIEQISLLKIDVEGLEMDVLKGAKDMIEQERVKYIQFEFNSNNAYTKTNMNDFIQFLKAYNLYRLLSDGWINISDEDYLLREIYAFQNIIAVRK
ncbi:MAG TPA: FkbM family methyltransferase [Chitinophagales bacterium]|nr:FkbM family methyltransferase [Chitinophagales bacterium]